MEKHFLNKTMRNDVLTCILVVIESETEEGTSEVLDAVGR